MTEVRVISLPCAFVVVHIVVSPLVIGAVTVLKNVCSPGAILFVGIAVLRTVFVNDRESAAKSVVAAIIATSEAAVRFVIAVVVVRGPAAIVVAAAPTTAVVDATAAKSVAVSKRVVPIPTPLDGRLLILIKAVEETTEGKDRPVGDTADERRPVDAMADGRRPVDEMADGRRPADEMADGRRPVERASLGARFVEPDATDGVAEAAVDGTELAPIASEVTLSGAGAAELSAGMLVAADAVGLASKVGDAVLLGALVDESEEGETLSGRADV